MKAELITFRGTPCVELESSTGARAVIALHGAQVLSWNPAGSSERLYLSERAEFRSGHPIRGGIPVIFPQFGRQGPWPQSHGFARRREWELVDHRARDTFACATFRLCDNGETRTGWPHAFVAELTVMIEAARLDIELEIANVDIKPFEFTTALHTYLRLGNVELARLEGLEGLDYLDNADGGRRRRDDRHALLIDDQVDRSYLAAKQPLLLSETGQQLAIEQSGFSEVVVWNPWQNGIAGIPDMAPLDFKRMLCVEAANVQRPVRLLPDEDWCGRQTLIAL